MQEVPIQMLNATQFLDLVSKLHAMLNSKLDTQYVGHFVKSLYSLSDLQNYITQVLLKDYTDIEHTVRLFASLMRSTQADLETVRPLS